MMCQTRGIIQFRHVSLRVLVITLMFIMVSLSGCVELSGSTKKDKSSPDAFSEKKDKSSADAFAEYKENRPEPGFEPTGVADVDVFGLSVSTLYEASIEELDNYLLECENHKTYQAYFNDITLCQGKAESDDDKERCAVEIYSNATPEQQAEIDAFREANEGKVANNLEQMAGVAGMATSVYSIVSRGSSVFYELGFNIFSAIKTAQNMKKQTDYLVKTKAFFHQQKSVMNQLETYKGR
jgi:hypothetical protein